MNKKEAYKIVIVLRKDLELPAGKWIAQAVHSTLRISSKFLNQVSLNQEYFNEREMLPTCIVTYVKNEKELLSLVEKAKQQNISFGLQRDVGFNFLNPDTITCLALGPDKKSKIDKLTKRLRVWNV